MKLNWKKDEKLHEEFRKRFDEHKHYESQAIFLFGLRLGIELAEDSLNIFPWFRAPNEFPDAILHNEDTDEVLNVEFELFSSDFQRHGHDPSKCDLLVCLYHDWKECPIQVWKVLEEPEEHESK